MDLLSYRRISIAVGAIVILFSPGLVQPIPAAPLLPRPGDALLRGPSEDAPPDAILVRDSRAAFTVDSAADTVDAAPGDGVCADAQGGCSLRAAIMEANALAGTDSIAFNIPGGGTQTIRPATELPPISESVIIDGYTQPGSSPNSNDLGQPSNAVITIELDGSMAGILVDHALRIDVGTSTIRGLAINRFPQWGINLAGGSGNTIAGNFIGTDASGASDRGNAYAGLIVSSPGNTIGGTTAEARNVISGNDASGVILTGLATGNFVQGNYIGTDKSGTTDLGNFDDGVRVLSDGNTIGGDAPGAGNIISGNDDNGVLVGGVRNAIISNSIYSNSLLGIDLGGAGVTLNDAGDADGGANNLQNFPVLTSATRTGAGTIVEGTLDSTTDTEFVLEFFSSVACDPSGYGEGQVVLGTETVLTDENGDASFGASLAVVVAPGHVATATATDPLGNTSEFSQCVAATGPVTFVVNSNNDSNDGNCNAAHCSFREAINAANSHTGFTDVIAFDIPGPGPHAIRPTSLLPEITQPVIVDGYTQPGASPNTNGPTLGSNAVLMIELDGSGVLTPGLRISGGSTTVRGLAVNRFRTDAIMLFSPGSNVIEGNFIGPDTTGTVNLGNEGSGVWVQSDNNTVGGTTPAARNVLTGNGWGVQILTTGNVVQGNLIGTDITGTTALASAVTGVRISGPGNTIGGLTAEERNVVSGNGIGIYLDGAGAVGNVIRGNFIGTDVTGTSAIANVAGVRIYGGANSNTLGGETAGAANVISGNTTGVEVFGSTTTGNVFRGNLIGTDPTGTVDVGNGVGIQIDSPANTVGGSAAGAGNVISGNGNGLSISGQDNIVEGNLIGTDITATADLGNSIGVRLGGTHNIVGGTSAPARNVISGNGNGVYITGGHGNFVYGNFIGTDSSGTVALANTYGVKLQNGASGNSIGGTLPGAGNVISGNQSTGIEIIQSTSSANIVQGNLIGTDVSGILPLGNGSQGLRISWAPDTVVGGAEPGAGNVISANGAEGVEACGSSSTGTLIQGNLIGLDLSGTLDLGNAASGVLICDQASDTTVGGTTAGARNIISGNGGIGVNIAQGAFGNEVLGNLIGTDISGSIAQGNLQSGVKLDGPDNTVGGTAAGAGNLVSGNTHYGVWIASEADGTVLQGNLIGTDASGSVALGNTLYGVQITSASGNTIGGSTASARNVISGNGRSGVYCGGGAGAAGTSILGNFIGTQADGASPLGNGHYGVELQSPSGITVGGTDPGAGNTIAFNGRDGVYANSGDGNAVRSNSIHTNTGLGIELRTSFPPYTGVTPNDPGDGDTGTNELQNYPDLTVASSDGGTVVIAGTLDSVPEADYAVDLFANVACDPSDHGEGETYLGSTAVALGVTGPESFTVSIAAEVPVDQYITATATDPLGNTSEFSRCVLVVDGDCNSNGIHDFNDIAEGTSTDCNGNGIPDACDVGPSDPDGNGEVSADDDGNGLPDECVLGDMDGNGIVDLDDFIIFVLCVTGWGVPPLPGCGLADLDGDGDVDLADFQVLQIAFGV